MILDCSKSEFVLSIPARQFGLLIGQLYTLRLTYAEHVGSSGAGVAEIDQLLAAADAEFARHAPAFAACAERGPARVEVPLVRIGQGDSTRDWPTNVGRVSPADSPEPCGAIPQVG